MRLIPTSITQKTADPTGGMTIDALMARQKMLAQQRPEIPAQIASPWQGASLMANTFVNQLQQNQAAGQEKASRDLLAQTIAGIDPIKGATPEQEASIMKIDPDTGMKYIADAMTARRDAAKEQAANAEWERRYGIEQAGKKDLATAEAGTAKLSDIGALRDDYTKSATTYDQASPSWQSMKEAAATSLAPDTADNAQGKGAADYNMIVGFAKLLDPNSVVREGEVSSATNLGGHIDTVQSWLNQWKLNGGKLDDNVRRAIMSQANSRMKSYYDQVKQKHDWITGVAGRHNILPEDVVSPLGEFQAWAPPEDPNKPQTRPEPTVLLPGDPRRAVAEDEARKALAADAADKGLNQNKIKERFRATWGYDFPAAGGP